MNGRFGLAAGSRLAGYLKPSNFLLAGCVLIALWIVAVPVSALFYNAFTEDTGFGPGAFSLQNFVDAYSDWGILALFRNSLVFAVGTALTTFVLGGLSSWAVERTDAPGAALFHSLALLSFAVPGLLMAMAWIFVFSPNIGWANALMKNAFGLDAAPFNIYTMAGHDLGAVEPLFPARLSVARPGAARARRAHGGGRPRLRRRAPGRS